MAQKFTNNAFSSLAAALTSIGTTLTVASGQGDRFPAVGAPDFAMVTLQDAANNIEIVKVTSRLAGGDAMTIVRAQEGTTARAWSIGDIVELRITAFGLNPLSVFEGGATAAALRLALLVPTRTGGDASGTRGISITGNAATATTAGSTTGNAGTATALQTARAINGANFDGTAPITTLSWGTARTITLGASGKSVNGSADVSWTLAEIGAAAASATVNLTGDQTIAGAKTLTGQVSLSAAAPILNFIETDQVLPAGRRRLVADGNTFSMRRNTAAGGDFSTEVSDINVDASGNFTASGNVTAFSDERLKKNWSSSYTEGYMLQALAWIQAGSYDRIDTGERQVGVSAQSLRLVMPEAVQENADGMLSVAYGNAALVACVALAREVVQLRERLAVLEAR